MVSQRLRAPAQPVVPKCSALEGINEAPGVVDDKEAGYVGLFCFMLTEPKN
jgi:hypothetical protein